MTNYKRPRHVGQPHEEYPDENRREVLRASMREVCLMLRMNTPDIFFASNVLLDIGMDRVIDEDGS